MPTRTIRLARDEHYHIINRGINSSPIFNDKRDYIRFIKTFLYYQNTPSPFKFANFLSLPVIDRNRISEKLSEEKKWLVNIVAYCLMPNHFHLLLKQIAPEGIKNFMRLLGNSYSHFFNIKHSRKGPLFNGRFRAVHINTNEQLLHLSRYIHLNPYSSFVVKDIEKLADYPYSSLSEYLGKTRSNSCQKDVVLNQFNSPKDYEKFVFNQADYQRSLQQIKRQILE